MLPYAKFSFLLNQRKNINTNKISKLHVEIYFKNLIIAKRRNKTNNE